MMLVFNDLENEPTTVSPDHLTLSTPGSDLLQPQPINIQSSIERFHKRTIKRQHETTAPVVFALTARGQFGQLVYDNQDANLLALALKP